MDIRKVKKLIDLVEESNIEELEIREGEESVKIKRQSDDSQFRTDRSISTSGRFAQVTVESTPDHTLTEPIPEKIKEVSGHIIKAPMVGTFYRSPSPDAKPFFEIGDTVNSGDTLCVIEAMKILNQIETDIGGIISQILVENAQPVEYNQPLFVID